MQIDDTSSIEALDTGGVQLVHPDFTSPRIVPLPIRPFMAKEDDIEAGIAFLQSQLGTRYSYLDCLDALPLIKRLGIEFVIRGKFDCSHLVAEYLKHIDCLLSAKLYPDTNATAALSPNDLARAAGLK